MVKNLGLTWEFSIMNVQPQSPTLFPEPFRCLLSFSDHTKTIPEPQFALHYLSSVSSLWKLPPSTLSPAGCPYSEQNLEPDPSLNLENTPSTFIHWRQITHEYGMAVDFPDSHRHPQCCFPSNPTQPTFFNPLQDDPLILSCSK